MFTNVIRLLYTAPQGHLLYVPIKRVRVIIGAVLSVTRTSKFSISRMNKISFRIAILHILMFK